MELEFTFLTIATAIAKLFVIMLVGYVLYARKFIGEKCIDTLSFLLVRVIFPALIISKTITHFSFSEHPFWWFFPICAIVFSLVGIFFGRMVYPLFKNFPLEKEFILSCGFQNGGYLPMNLILFSFAGAMADKLLIYLFLFILGFNLLMWSLVPLFLTGTLKKNFRWRVLLNPPVVATVFSIAWVAFFGKESLPHIIMDPLKQMGQAAFPLAMITLGAYLARYRAYNPEYKAPLAACVLIKLFIFPAIVLTIMKFVPLDYSYKFFLFLQSLMPTAVSLVVIGSYTGGDNRFFSSSIFYTHLIAILSIPLWMALFRAVIG